MPLIRSVILVSFFSISFCALCMPSTVKLIVFLPFNIPNNISLLEGPGLASISPQLNISLLAGKTQFKNQFIHSGQGNSTGKWLSLR
uniref:Putative secreted protein ovary overexpressed n=1 Tax=Rhipicephalus microplus TaxID=6941 RepID=A0A6M2DAJ6_RHIMP